MKFFIGTSNGIVALFVVIFSIHPNGYTQNSTINFEHFTNLSAYVVPAILQDREGFLWFGTSGGIDRYDGYSVTSYKNEPGDPNSINNGSVQTLYEDRQGDLWVGTSRGLDKMDRKTGKFTHYFPYTPGSGTEFSNYILSICEDRPGFLWIGTANGLNKFDRTTGEFIHFLHNEADNRSISNNFVHAVYEDRTGSLWIGTGNGLDKLDTGTGEYTHYWNDPEKRVGTVQILWNNSIEYTSTFQITSIYEDNAGNLWLSTNGEGLIEFNPKTGKYTVFTHDDTDPHSISDNQVQSVCQDSKGIFWIATKYAGVNSFNGHTGNFSRYYHNPVDPGSLSIDLTLSVLCERSGTLWITSYTGVNKLNMTGQSFIQYPSYGVSSQESPMGGGVSNLMNSNDGRIWIGTDIGWELFDPETDIFTHRSFGSYYFLAEDKSGNLWFTKSTGGISKKERNGPVVPVKDNSGKEIQQHINCIHIGSGNEETIWLGTLEGEIFRIDPQTNKAALMLTAKTSVKTLLEDTYGILWAGTKDGGLLQFDPEKGRSVLYTSDSGGKISISGNSIISILEDRNRTLWFATNLGLNRFDRSSDTFVHFTEKNGLPSNLIMAIVEDDHGMLWLSTDKGICRFDPETEKVRNYDVTNGLATERFYLNTRCRTKNGEIYFGGPGGLTRFHPDSLVDNPFIPAVTITSVRIFDDSYPMNKPIHLAHSENFISFEFAALSFVSPEKNQYAYMMEGVDKDWVQAGTRRFVSYPDLRPGNYIFKVKGSNNDGVWNDVGTQIPVVISPPWWKTNVAYGSYFLLLVFTLYYARRYELNRISLKNQVIKKEETEKLKSAFFANISHEFRTPLTLILGPVEKIISSSGDENIIKDSGIIKRNAVRLLQLVNQLLDLSKLDSGKLKLEVIRGNIVSLVKGVAMSFESLAESTDITLKILPEKEYIEMYFDRDKLIKIISNLLSNAFKFTPKNGKIIVRISESGRSSIQITIRDTGIGIAAEEIPYIFDRFYQVDSSLTKKYEGSGIGLALTKELVELHHGNISVKSESGPSCWTEFTIEFPAGRAHVHNTEILPQSDETLEIHEGEVVVDVGNLLKSGITGRATSSDETASFRHDKLIILVVEDNNDMRNYIKECLTGNYQVEEALNGEQGVRKAESIIPDLIISDIMMPKMDGNELTRLLKNNEKTSHIPIVLLTAKSSHESKLEGLQTGADDYLTKPFDVKELQIRIDNLITLRKKLQERLGRPDLVYKPEVKKLRGFDEKFINKVLKVIEDHISDEEFNIEEFAGEIGMSRVQLHRKLKAIVGKSASQYLRSVRLTRAKRMIEEELGNVSEIAYSVGFSSPAYFTRCFKELFGYPPSDLITYSNYPE